MLNDYLTFKGVQSDLFNHDVYTKETLFLKNPERLNEKVILIFPISTTFSTSLKVQSEIREKLSTIKNNRRIQFLGPVINCIVIAPEPLDNTKIFAQGSPAYDYGWQEVNTVQRKITVMHLDRLNLSIQNQNDTQTRENSTVEQHYFISLNTSWNKIDSCKECYPRDKSEEVCLIETKANSITPNLIFGYPRSYPYDTEKNIFSHFTAKKRNGTFPVVYRRHIKKFGNNYIYFIRVARFLQHNKDKVTTWLRTNCTSLVKHEDKNVVIITTTAGSNSGFVNLVNDVLFSDVATIIQYNPREEFLQNFILFYTELLQRADIVIYADDVLATTRSISELNFFVKHARPSRKGIDYSISLINRTGYFNYKKLQHKIKVSDDAIPVECIFNFTDIHVPPITHREKYPYITLVEKFRELSSKSVLDTMRLYFKRREQKFIPLDLGKEYDELIEAGNSSALLQFLVFHEFMKLFRCENDDHYTHSALIGEIFESGESSALDKLVEFVKSSSPGNSITDFCNAYPEFQDEIKNAVLKLCSSEPFIQHGKIKQAVFKWVLNELQTIVMSINKNKKVEKSFFEAKHNGKAQKYTKYQTFMFLLKRASKLKINYIYL